LLRAFRFKGVSADEGLLPGLSEQDVVRETSWFPAPFPDDLKALYGWRNGQKEDAWSTKHVFEFRGLQFTSVSRARNEYESMMASYGAEGGRDSYHVDLRTCFPFASFNGNWLVLPCDGHDLDPEREFPVVHVAPDFGVFFHSIQSMLDTCIAWVSSPEWGRAGHIYLSVKKWPSGNITIRAFSNT
jgi:hypothetical protein